MVRAAVPPRWQLAFGLLLFVAACSHAAPLVSRPADGTRSLVIRNVAVFDAPQGRGPYGIAATPAGEIYYASLAGNHIARIDLDSGAATVLRPPTAGQGARRVWSDSRGHIWLSEWNAGQAGVYRPADGTWGEWKLPGARPQAYAVYVDEADGVWLSDWSANAMVRFDPATESFTTVELPSPSSGVRQILGRPGEVWLPLSGVDKLAVIRMR